MSDLRVAMEDLADHVLAQMAFFRDFPQVHDQFIETLEKHGVAFFRYLLVLAHGQQDAAQMGEEGEVVVVVCVGHCAPMSLMWARL